MWFQNRYDFDRKHRTYNNTVNIFQNSQEWFVCYLSNNEKFDDFKIEKNEEKERKKMKWGERERNNENE